MKKIPQYKETFRIPLGFRTKTLGNKSRRLKHVPTAKEHMRQEELLFTLQKISQVLTAEVNLQDILRDMATIVAKSLGAKWVNFWELTKDKKALYIVAHHGMSSEYMEHSRRQPIPVGFAWIGRAVKTGKPWGTNDILKDPNLLKDLGPKWEAAIKKQNYRAILCVPLSSGKTILGGMCTYFVKEHEFSDFEMRLMMVAANQAATAINNARIFGELLAERNKSISMINSLSDGLILYDLNKRIIEFNPRSEEIFWVSRDEVINKFFLELSSKNPFFKNIIGISSLPLTDFETGEIIIEDPQRMFLKITQVPVRNAQDQKLGSMRIIHDITREKESEELKSNFVSVASHQIRTPLSRIKWILDMFLKGELGKLETEQHNFIKKLYDENEQMITLIKDFLDISKIEEGRFDYNFQPVDIVELTSNIVSGFSKTLKEKKIKVIFNAPLTAMPKINADIDKLTMVIQNIIDNSIKYTLPEGKISISFYKGLETLVVNFKDTGIGIPKEQQKFIFTKLFRARNALRLQTEGSGLGLWIANEIIKKHNGKFYIESEENKGSTFSIQFPINPR